MVQFVKSVGILFRILYYFIFITRLFYDHSISLINKSSYFKYVVTLIEHYSAQNKHDLNFMHFCQLNVDSLVKIQL